jgi:hypothetical protein
VAGGDEQIHFRYHSCMDPLAFNRIQMDCYDQLPPAVRQALANAKFPYAAEALLMQHFRGQTDAALVAMIQQADRNASS